MRKLPVNHVVSMTKMCVDCGFAGSNTSGVEMDQAGQTLSASARNRCEDLFIVYGMPRTGTTYLYHALAQHPDIFVSYRKESLFFSVNFEKGLDWYQSLFADKRAGEIAADINPTYFMDDSSLGRVLDFKPDVKAVLGVRDPIDYSYTTSGFSRSRRYPFLRQSNRSSD